MSTVSPEGTRQRLSYGHALLTAWQGFLAFFLALATLGSLTEIDKLKLPGAPVELYWTTFGLGILLILAHVPFSFGRLRKGGRVAAYVGLVGYIILRLATEGEMYGAWIQTPQGAAEHKAALAAEQAQAKYEQQERELDATARKQEEAQQQAKQARGRVAHCFSWGGHLPALEDQVRDSLGNPDSFKHVQTEATEPDVDGFNVLMTFRAQNRMGALWTYTIRAKIDPDSCNIADIENQPREA